MKGRFLEALAGVERWAIHRPVYEALMQLARGLEGAEADPAVVNAITMERMEVVAASPAPGVAVIPIHGIIEPRRSFWTEYFGGTSIEGLRLQFRKALADESVKGIVFDVCSPGGDAIGVEEMASEIFKARGIKPMIAAVNCRAASAAYWLASQADELVGLQAAADCGSIGCFTCHFDWSKWNEQFGIVPTYVYAGQFKVEGNPDQPLSDEARAFYQTQVDEIYGRFVAAVARGRGVTPASVKADFGQGRCFMMAQAIGLKMVDRLASLDDLVSRVAKGRPGRAAAVAAGEDDRRDPVAPDDENRCPDGYELGEDGLCHWAPNDGEETHTIEGVHLTVRIDGKELAAAAAAALEAAAVAPTAGEAAGAADAIEHDREWLGTF